jgi:hypothetical protein
MASSHRSDTSPRAAALRQSQPSLDADRLERLDRLETVVDAMRQTLETQFRRIAAMQAQLDRLKGSAR